VIGDYLHKGSRVYLEGRKRTESWDDKQTGAIHYRDLVYIDRIEFLGDSKANGNGNGNHESGDDNRSYEETTIDEGNTRVPF
jgi:single-strand DNA-binding protein